MTDDRTPTHPGGLIDEDAVQRGWRLGVVDSWRAIRGKADVRQARIAIERLGNVGPADDLAERAKR